jgi:hypothetical protein
MITIKDNIRYYNDYKINSTLNRNGSFRYSLDVKNIGKIFAVLNMARHEFKQPAVAHLVLRD